MRDITFPESGSKRKLLDAAEQLFAERGFEAVSVRDITQLAKTNVAAVNYHFGSRESLLTMVMTRYMTPVNEERLARLDTLERKWSGKPVPLEEIIDALVRPLVGQVRKSELSERLFYKLIGRTFAQQGDGLPSQIEEQLRSVVQRFTRAFAKALPTVSADDLSWRIHFMVGGMIHMLTHQDILHRLTGGASGTPSMDAVLSRFIRFSAAGMREGLEAEAPTAKGPQVMFDF
ncbi:MAG: TetR/AcrR family transcriptional regulator [Luteolibacter sp.]